AGLRAPAGDVLLVLAAGARLSAYVGATVGEIGFLRGIWVDGARRLAWLEDYAASVAASADRPVPARLTRGIRFEHVSFAYPGTDRLVLDDVTLDLPAGAVVAVVGENGAGTTTLAKLLAKLYEPSAGRRRAAMYTQLGPTWPEGVEVSFGQGQKLALARGFMRDRTLVMVLDEPTAALDAETEHALFERYAAAAGRKGGASADGDGRV